MDLVGPGKCGSGTSAGRWTFRDVAADLNVNPETLRTWARAEPEGVEAELARLRARTARLLKAEKEWQN